MTRHVLDLPDAPYPSLNTRRDKRWDSRQLRHWRHTAHLAARAAKVPPLSGATVRLHYWPGDRRRRDAVNLALVHKACVDGLVDAGVLVDDDPDHVTELMPAIWKGKGDRRWELIIEEPDDV